MRPIFFSKLYHIKQMNINKEQIDDVNIVYSVQVGKDDYESKVNDILRDYRRKANMQGFRPGKVPESLIRKMYGKAVLIEEINKLVSESLQNYIKEEQLSVLGDPLPRISGDEIDWEIGNDFTFEFEIGLAPEINVNLSKEDRLTKYQIVVDREMIDKELDYHTRRYGQYVETDAVIDFSEKLDINLVQLGDDGQPLQDGHSAENSILTLSFIKDEKKKPFENLKTGDEIVFNLSETVSTDYLIASLLKKDKEKIGDISASLFKLTVNSIQKLVDAELNQELFDNVLGEGKVTSLEEFENKIKEALTNNLEQNSKSKLVNDAREYFLEKISPRLPEEHLLKWITSTNAEANKEEIEKEFPAFLKNMKWDLISKAIVKENDLKVEEQELINYAVSAVRQHFAMYGKRDLSEEELKEQVSKILDDERSVRELASQILENKAIDRIIETVEIVSQEISYDEFKKYNINE